MIWFLICNHANIDKFFNKEYVYLFNRLFKFVFDTETLIKKDK